MADFNDFSKIYERFLELSKKPRPLTEEPVSSAMPLSHFFIVMHNLAENGIRGTVIRRLQKKTT